MKIVIDSQLLKDLKRNPAGRVYSFFMAGEEKEISFGWPAFLEYLELDLLLPTIDQSHPLYTASIVTLHENTDREAHFYVYDNLFAVSLAQVKTHPQMNASFLLHALHTQRKKEPALEPLLSSVLDHYEKRLTLHPLDAMHDLILYLAWDRMCLAMRCLFDYQSAEPKFHQSLAVFKQCLIESYQHIASQKKTSPSLYRLFEALLFYEMREENLEKHPEAQWEVFARAFPVLKHPDELPDFLYIDDSIEHSAHYLTLETGEEIEARLRFVRQMNEKIKGEFPEWKEESWAKKITSLRE